MQLFNKMHFREVISDLVSQQEATMKSWEIMGNCFQQEIMGNKKHSIHIIYVGTPNNTSQASFHPIPP